MIRERRTQDLDPLCAIVAALGVTANSTAGADPRAWLEIEVAMQSWVYDMAPVHVAPTKNVVGHVQIYRPAGSASSPFLDERTGRPLSDLLAIGRFLVKPQAHDYGIARHLLRESRIWIERHGKTAVVDLRDNCYLTPEFCKKHGFTELPSENPTPAQLIFTG